MNESELRHQIVLGCRILSRRGLVEAFGHISARLEDGGILMTPRKALLLVEDDEICRLDADGKQVGGTGSPPVETNMHLAAYRARPDIWAIARTHSPITSSFAAMGRPVRAIHGFGTHLGEVVPVYEEVALVSNADRANGVAQTLDDLDAVLLRGNGTLVTAPNVVEAVMRAIWLEEAAGIQWRIFAAGENPIYLTPEEVDERRVMDMPHEPIRAWDYEVAMLAGGTVG
jgi:HCOMODA/2-hydroxy-3-carboxy-muconic semialdehyde decarboxylase